jgi:hypothetical protein
MPEVVVDPASGSVVAASAQPIQRRHGVTVALDDALTARIITRPLLGGAVEPRTGAQALAVGPVRSARVAGRSADSTIETTTGSLRRRALAMRHAASAGSTLGCCAVGAAHPPPQHGEVPALPVPAPVLTPIQPDGQVSVRTAPFSHPHRLSPRARACRRVERPRGGASTSPSPNQIAITASMEDTRP